MYAFIIAHCLAVYAPSIFFLSHYGPRAGEKIALVFAINIKVQNAFFGAQQGRHRAIMGFKKN